MAKKGGNVGTEIAEKILLYYENLNPDWLLTGRGEMLRDIKHAEPELSPIIKDTVPYPEPKKKCLSCEEKEKVIIAYNETINSLKQTVSIQNLILIREIGLEAFIKQETIKWQCPVCEQLLCVHRNKCLHCGNENIFYKRKQKK